jgi:hypothetical protein
MDCMRIDYIKREEKWLTGAGGYIYSPEVQAPSEPSTRKGQRYDVGTFINTITMQQLTLLFRGPSGEDRDPHNYP